MRLLRPSVIYSRPVLTIILGAALVVVPLLALANIIATSVGDGLDRSSSNGGLIQTEETKMGQRIAELSERIKHAEMLNQERKREIISLRTQIESLDRLSRMSNDPSNNISYNNIKNNFAMLDLTQFNQHRQNVSQSLAAAASASITSDLIQVPSISAFLPHLLNSPDPLRPAYRRASSKSSRNAATIVFGVPTVRRPVESYLLSTLANLIVNMTPEESAQAIIVVFIAEVSEPSIVYY